MVAKSAGQQLEGLRLPRSAMCSELAQRGYVKIILQLSSTQNTGVGVERGDRQTGDRRQATHHPGQPVLLLLLLPVLFCAGRVRVSPSVALGGFVAQGRLSLST
jgi:hypothetical protein